MKKSKDKQLSDLLKSALTATPDTDAVERMQQVVDNELERQHVPVNDILTFNEVASFLRVSADVLETYLEEIPCFELGGQLLFRKEAVMEWISEREQKYHTELNLYTTNEPKVITIA